MDNYHTHIVKICIQIIFRFPKHLTWVMKRYSQEGERTKIWFSDIKATISWTFVENPYKRQSIPGADTPVMLYGKNFGSMNYDDAKNRCFWEVGFDSLPVPNSDIENKFIRSLLLDDQHAWLGITDRGDLSEVRTYIIYTV